jgi:outer membrane lipoprotein-sorting protein
VQAEDTLESVVKRLEQKSKEIRTLTATVTMQKDGVTERGTYKAESRGRYEFARESGKILFRIELESVVRNVVEGKKRELKNTMLRIGDGEYAYKLLDVGGKRQAIKTRAGDILGPDPEVTFATLRKKYAMRLLADESLNGRAVYVIETKAQGDSADGSATQLYFAKDTGTMLKMVNRSEEGRHNHTIEYTDIKLNPKIAPSRFVFKAPEGVELVDHTKE